MELEERVAINVGRFILRGLQLEQQLEDALKKIEELTPKPKVPREKK